MEAVQGRGRPLRPKKSSVLTTRITSELRGALEAAAERGGMSISEVAAAWLERGRVWAAAERVLIRLAEQRA